MIDASEFRPDWSGLWTVEEVEEELVGFTFKGPGWYIDGRQTFLVIPYGEHVDPFGQDWPKSQQFWFYCYDGYNPSDAFCAIVNAPTRFDSR